MFISGYEIGEMIADTPRSAIYKAYHSKNPDRTLVIKFFKSVRVSKYKKDLFVQRIERLKLLGHPLLIVPDTVGVKDDVFFAVRDYFEGITLSQLAGANFGTDLKAFLTVACQLAEALNSIHEAGIVHGGIRPNNILVDPVSLDIRIVGFISSLYIDGISHFIYDTSFIRDILSYTSPEQTGRINHSAGPASDLYSLGIVFYEMLAGQLPFYSQDPLQLIHSHLAEEAKPVHEVKPGIPKALGSIIAKLMCKEPEKRYQTAAGLLADIMRCRDEYEATGTISEFPPDGCAGLRRGGFVSKMVGRDREVRVITEKFEKAAAGEFQCLFISGLPGVGKTRLIQELQQSIVKRRGYFTSGKFDVYQKNIPYSSLVQALRNLIRTFLTESDERLSYWRERIQQAVGNNGRVLTDVIPELEILIGHQPEAVRLPPMEQLNRFRDVFDRFLSCLASKENPLILFVDDLQWCDNASFDFLINTLRNHREHSYLLLLGAYRCNEVDSSHPLSKLIRYSKKNGWPLKEIRLGPLEQEHCHEMVSCILKSPKSQTGALSDFIYTLSEGNPLFASEILSYIYNENLLYFDEEGKWNWDIDRIRQSSMPNSVVDLFKSKVQKVSSELMELLKYCACMGNTFSPNEITAILNIPLARVFGILKPAFSQGLLMESGNVLQFIHDRVQEAVLASIPARDLGLIHWRIGSYLYSAAADAGGDTSEAQDLFTIVSHLNLGMKDHLKREEAYFLSYLNYQAGNKALDSLAIQAANEYFRISRELLPEDCWENENYDLTYRIYQRAAKTELMCGSYENSEVLLNNLLSHAKTDIDRAECLAEQTTSLSSIGNFKKAIEKANEGLAYFGKAIPENGEEADKKRKELMAEIASKGTDIRQVILDMPFTDDRRDKIELAFYSELIPVLYLSGLVPQLYLAAAKSTQHCLAGGMDESVIYSFTIMGLLYSEQGDFEQAFMYEDLARDLCARHPNTFGATRGMNGIVWCNMHSRSHPEQIVEYCFKAIRCGKNCGDLYNAGLSYGPLMWSLQVWGSDLPKIEEYAEECLQFSNRYHLSFSVGLAQAMQAGWILPMRKGYKEAPMEEKLKEWEADNHIASIGSYYILRAISHYYFGEYVKAKQYLEGGRKYLSGLTDNVLKRQWHVFLVLNKIKLYERGIDYKAKSQLLADISPVIKKIETWAALGPLLKPYLAFIYAELERVTGSSKETRSLYMDAISIARSQKYTLLEGHLNECFGEFLIEEGLCTQGIYFAEAARLYRKCGAKRKEINLVKKHPGYYEEGKRPSLLHEAVPLEPYVLPNLDVDYLMKSSLAISSEIERDSLLKRIMDVVIESSGAQHGYLLIAEQEDLYICAESHAGEVGAARTVKQRLDDVKDICKAIVRYVYRTGERLILSSAARNGMFRDNPEVVDMQLRSVLCLPVIKRSMMIGVLYLENRISDGVFTPEKTQMTELLTSQAAISLQNARLVEEMKQVEEALRRSKEELELRVRERTEALARVNYQLEKDIARRKKAEEEIQKLNRELEQRVNERTAQLEEANRGLFESESHLRAALYEKEVLLKEIHHRVKNNLQIIHSMLNLQSIYTDDERVIELLKESKNRVYSMALIHEKLYQSETLARINLPGYIHSLVSNLFLSYGVSERTIRPRIEVEDVELSIDTIIPCALIINELVSNALKHAFRDVSGERAGQGELLVKLSRDTGSKYVLTVSDNGIGLPEGLDVENCTSLGLRIVGILVKQLRGSMTIGGDSGAEFTITFEALPQPEKEETK